MKRLTWILLFSALVASAQSIPGTDRLYLSGRGSDDAQPWDFFCTAGRNSGFWTTIRVPSCWEQEGFGTYDYGYEEKGRQPLFPQQLASDEGIYRREFVVPPEWKGRQVRIVFEGVLTDTHVSVNGTEVGPVHQGGFYQFSYDITNKLQYDRANKIEVRVRERSANESVNRAERSGDYWNFGGIFRPVYLESRPRDAIERVAIDARADGTFTADVFLTTGAGADSEITAQVRSLDGKEFGGAIQQAAPAGASTLRLTGKLANPRLWSAETPHLYTVDFALRRGSQPVHQIHQRFGFRTFEVRPSGGFYLNGHKLTIKGVNRHSFWPETGRTLSIQRHREDIQLMKEANMNAVRMSHYPPDAEFLDMCDEAGLYVLNELAGWQGAYDTPTGTRLIKQIVARDVNHPSILFWDNGNEGGENLEVDDEFAKHDPQGRPVLHPWGTFRGINTRHYRPYDVTAQLADEQNIFMPTEFLHGLYDGGHGAGLDDFWKIMGEKPRAAGGFLWSWADETIARMDQGGRLDPRRDLAPDGLVGPHLEKEGSYYTVRDIWSPVQIPISELPAGFSGTLPIRNRYDFLALSTCRFQWQLLRYAPPGTLKNLRTLLAHGTVNGPDVAPRSDGTLVLPLPERWRDADVLRLTAFDGSGRDIATWAWSLKQGIVPADEKSATSKAASTVADDAGSLVLTAGRVSVRISKSTGLLSGIVRDGRPFSLGNGPRVVAYGRDDRTFIPLPLEPARMEQIQSRQEGGAAIVEASYAGPVRKLRWTLQPNGDLQIDYVLRGPGMVEIYGLDFDYPEEKVKAKTWLGAGPYRVWQNRLRGPFIDQWDVDYNDTVPGETYVYPEFKGWFRDWRWVAYTTTEGRVAFLNDGSAKYFGAYSPRDGKVNPVINVPRLGLGIYHVIPATGTKGSRPEQLGPQSQPQNITGEVKGTLVIRMLDQW